MGIENYNETLDYQLQISNQYLYSGENSFSFINSEIKLINELSSTFCTKDGEFFEFSDMLTLIHKKFQEFFIEFEEENIDIQTSDKSLYEQKRAKIKETFHHSRSNLSNFIRLFDSNYITTLKPEVDVDYDGEIDFEWYGRIGARANLTFGKNGELYFVSLFHGESSSSKMYINKTSITKIQNDIERLFKDKFV
ncbi:MAG: hypothetical protein HW421_565 [Ignavibacteria bacterium]|nr:hypothetical protein [Ignavibacteria bacterium]